MLLWFFSFLYDDNSVGCPLTAGYCATADYIGRRRTQPATKSQVTDALICNYTYKGTDSNFIGDRPVPEPFKVSASNFIGDRHLPENERDLVFF